MRDPGLTGVGTLVLIGAFAVQAPTPRYTAEQLRCAAYLEEVRTTVDVRRGVEVWQEKGTRSARLQFRAQTAEAGIGFEAWYDSLLVRHDGREGSLQPDTDGLIGGRWLGLLTPHGEARLDARPFLPPELRAVSDLSDALQDFLPQLPTAALAPGDRWSDSLGLEVERLRDSVAPNATFQRYRWRITGRGGPAPIAGDSSARLRHRITDEGTVAWSPARGPLAWRRAIVVETDVMPGRASLGAVQGRVAQAIDVIRVTDPPECQ